MATTTAVHRSFRLSRPKPKDIYHELRGWTATDRLAASNKLRSAMRRDSGLKRAAEATAETIRELMVAKSVSIVLLDDRGYRDLVNVGQLARGEHRFPEDEPSTAKLLPRCHSPAPWRGVIRNHRECARQMLADYRSRAQGRAIGSG